MESIRAYKAAGKPNTTLQTNKNVAAIVGGGKGTFINVVQGPYQSLTEIATDYDWTGADLTKYGHTAIYRSAREFFVNGGRQLYIVETTLSAEQTSTTTPILGADSVDFTASLLAINPVPGSLYVTVNAVAKVEGTDYIVDYSSDVVYFKASFNGTHACVIKWKEYVVSNFEASILLFESFNVNLIAGSYAFHNTLLAKVKVHMDNRAIRHKHAIAFGTGVYKETTNIIAAAVGSCQSEYMSLWANRSGYFNDAISDPSVNWLEFTDPSSCILGVASAYGPSVSLHEKTMKNLNQNGEWTSTQVGLLNAAYVNYFSSNLYNGYNSKNGYLLDPSADWRYVDQGRTWIYIKDSCKGALDGAKLIGNVPVNRMGLTAVERVILDTMYAIYTEGIAIEDPNLLDDTFKDYKVVMSELIEIVKKDPGQWNPQELALIQTAQSTRALTVYVFYDYQGSLHTIDLYIGAL